MSIPLVKPEDKVQREAARPRKNELPHVATLLKQQQANTRKKGTLSVEDKVTALDMLKKGVGIPTIASTLGYPDSVVRTYLKQYQSTATEARLILEAGAERLAKRIVHKGNVEESLEVMDRLSILNAKTKGSTDTGPRFTLLVGMRGAAAPIPDAKSVQKAIEEENAAEAVIVSVNGEAQQ